MQQCDEHIQVGSGSLNCIYVLELCRSATEKCESTYLTSNGFTGNDVHICKRQAMFTTLVYGIVSERERGGRDGCQEVQEV